MPAGYAVEGCLIRSVLFVDAPARRALAGRVAGIDAKHRDARALGLVGQESAELPEGPGMQARSLTALGRNPRANMREVFKRNTAFGAFGNFNDRLR